MTAVAVDGSVVDCSVAVAGIIDVPGWLLLHGPTHAAESSSAVGMGYAAASVAFVGLLGGLLYWYYGREEAS